MERRHGFFFVLIFLTPLLYRLLILKLSDQARSQVNISTTDSVALHLHGGKHETPFIPANETLLSKVDLERLTKELWWPLPSETSVSNSTDHTKCSFSFSPSSNYFVGDIVNVTITARNANNKDKTYGGDFFQAKLYDEELKASTYGEVIDHKNGTYTARLTLLWVGQARVSIRLMHSSEAVQVLIRQREQDPDKVYFFGHFEEGNKKETMKCNAQKSSRLLGEGLSCCCEYKDPVSEEGWYCQQPSTLPCSALIYHSMGGYQAELSDHEDILLKSSNNKEIQGDVSVVQVQKQNKEGIYLGSQTKCKPGLQTPVPAGFYLRDAWTSLVCNARQFTTAEAVSTCLKDKQILMMGDSTLRQWFEYLENAVPSLKRLNLHTSGQSGPLELVDLQSNTLIIWRAHGLPLRTTKTPKADLHYIASELEGLAGGIHTVVVFNIWAHFTTYPIAMYIHRLVVIRQAVLALLRRSPSTLVLIKSANTGYKDVYGSDWLSWQLDKALRVVFRDLPVVLIDVWQMTSCHYSPDNIHPPSVVVQNEVDLFLSFICAE